MRDALERLVLGVLGLTFIVLGAGPVSFAVTELFRWLIGLELTVEWNSNRQVFVGTWSLFLGWWLAGLGVILTADALRRRG